MITGRSRVEAVIPGDPHAITGVMERVGGGIAPARQVIEAWQGSSLPSWQGRGGTAWRHFAAREAQALASAPAAFDGTAKALMHYESAFRGARAEVQTAIEEMAAAERATEQAQAEHAAAVRRFAQASPEARVAAPGAFFDPGAHIRERAQARADAAQARLRAVGDEVAAQIRACARQVSGASSTLSLGGSARTVANSGSGTPTRVDPSPFAEFGRGVGDAIAGAVLGVKDLVMLLGGESVVALFTGGTSAVGEVGRDRGAVRLALILMVLQGRWGELSEMGAGALGHAAGDMVGLEHWQEGNFARGAGRVAGEAALVLLAFTKIGKVGTFGRATESAERLAPSRFRSTDKLATEFFGKENAGKPITIGKKTLVDLGKADKSARVRVVDGTAFKTEAAMRKEVLKYAEGLAGHPLQKIDKGDGMYRMTTKVTRPDGTQYTINIRDVSSSAHKNEADVRLTLEFIDDKNYKSNQWPYKHLELKFGWEGK